MSVLVAIIGNDFARAHEFTASAIRLETPPGSKVEMLIGGDWCGARNTLAKQCLEGDYTHLWFMDDDHSFAPDLLMRLLEWDKDLVTPICLTRVYPFVPVSYVKAPPGSPADYMPIDLADCPSSGLVKLASGGCAGMLIKREVLEATRFGMSWDEAGGTRTDGQWFEYGDQSEDIVFCNKAIAAGYELYADVGARLGHITTAVAIPHWTPENGWVTRMRFAAFNVDLENAYDMIGRDQIEVATEAVSIGADVPAEASPDPLPDPPAVLKQPLPEPFDPAVPEAERIEIWVDEDMMWWWRAIDEKGRVLARDSAVRESDAIAAATARYPECAESVFQIARELDDSRQVQQFGPPRRLWNREPE